MINKKMCILILSFVFAVIMIAVGFFALTVNDISVDFTMCDSDDTQVLKVKEELKVFEGRNLLFVDKEDVVSVIEKDPYLECISVEKKFPGTVNIVVVERREAYITTFGEKTYLLDQTGFVLSEYVGDGRRDLITLNFIGVTVQSVNVGEYISTDLDQNLRTSFEIAKSVNLTDCIKVMTVENKVIQTDVIFDTYTNVKIRIVDCGVKGIEKAQKAFNVYDTEEKDYIKSFNELQAYLKDGEPVAVWTRYSA